MVEKLSDGQVAALTAYAASGLNASEAGTVMGLNPATLRARLDTVRKLTGLEPRNFMQLNELLGLLRKAGRIE